MGREKESLGMAGRWGWAVAGLEDVDEDAEECLVG